MSQKVCCVPGCPTVAGDGIPLQRFPDPPRNIDLYKLWIKKIGTHVAELDEDYVYRNRRVCRRHFEEVYLYPTKLCSLAVPSLCLAEDVTSTEAVIVSEPHISSSFIINSNEIKEDVTSTEAVIVSEPHTSSSFIINSNEIKGVHATSRVVPTFPSQKLKTKAGLKVKKTILTKEEKELHKVIADIKYKLKNCQKQKDHFKKKAAYKLKKNEAFDLLMQNMSEETKTFFAMQVTQFGKKAKGRRFTIKEKILSLALYKRSPKAYRFLSNFSILPKRKTLSQLLQKINLKPGKTVELFAELKKPVAKMNENHKFCTIIFDEMAISPNLTYCRKNDEVIGMVDDGEKKQKQISDHALVFMVRGVVKKFKQPVYFSFCRGSTKTESLKAQLKCVINEVEATGLKVVATVCDQGSSNRAAISSLLNDTRAEYLRDNKEYTGGFFEVNKKKIIPLYDAPHLMKGIRNNLLSKNLMFTQDGQKKIAKWEHIENMYHRQPGYKGVRLVPKLTAQHVVPKLIPKMKVKNCTQVFSKTVGVALGYMADCGQLSSEHKDTADLLIFMDELFDSVNGSYSKIRNGKIYRSAVTPKSPHHQLWRKSLPILKSMEFLTKDGRKASVPSISSWIKTIEGFQLLVNHLKSLNVTSLLLRNFNQDPLENFFGAIRAQGHSNNMPNAYGFQGAFKTLLVNNLTSPHSVGANCEKDGNFCLKNLKNLVNCNKYNNEDSENMEIDINDLNIENINTNILIQSKSPTDVERCAAIAYCSGWLVTKIQKKVFKNCQTCIETFKCNNVETFHRHIKMSDYNDKGWLCYPTRKIFDCFAEIENNSMDVLKRNSDRKNIQKYISLILLSNIDFNFVTCDVHKNKIIDYFIKETVIFFINNWCKEVNSVLNGKTHFFDSEDPIKRDADIFYKKNKLKRYK